eukprot:TRINITY_DN5259_c0_g1_i3.p1 TRINITY_DN5259_c0_g1~~TRINITY_DN5259_c0_g1_i3.p1  ORF type:complete len:102 (-),score=11.61 TRINITY_DN5259_c0_g1_i3:287-592(-)
MGQQLFWQKTYAVIFMSRKQLMCTSSSHIAITISGAKELFYSTCIVVCPQHFLHPLPPPYWICSRNEAVINVEEQGCLSLLHMYMYASFSMESSSQKSLYK